MYMFVFICLYIYIHIYTRPSLNRAWSVLEPLGGLRASLRESWAVLDSFLKHFGTCLATKANTQALAIWEAII